METTRRGGRHARGYAPDPGLEKHGCWAGRIMNAHLPEGEKMDYSPHVLRHTFLRQLAETKASRGPRGSGHQTAISGVCEAGPADMGGVISARGQG